MKGRGLLTGRSESQRPEGGQGRNIEKSGGWLEMARPVGRRELDNCRFNLQLTVQMRDFESIVDLALFKPIKRG